MKKLIIATSILFAFSATFAQEGKPSKKTPMSSKAPTSVSANEAKPNKKPNVKPNVKPVGKTSTKPSPVVSKVSPVKPAKPIGPASNRAAQSSKGASSRPEAVTEKQKPSKVNSRAAQSSKGASSRPEAVTEKQKPSKVNARAAQSSKGASSKPEAVTEKQKPSKVNSRAAQSSKGASSKPEAVTEKQKPSKVNARNFEKGENYDENKINNKTNSEKGEVNNFDEKKPTTPNKEISSNKPDADYCKGWKEGYMKAFSKATGEKISSSDVPNCISRGECEGYKCGYAAGVKNAERKIR